jgi:hypothetical protein
MKATDRHRQRVQDLINTPIQGEPFQDPFAGDYIEGETSDDVATYLPMAAGLVSELAKTQLKKKEDAERKAKLESGDAFKAQKVAEASQQKAAMAQADAMTENDPNGPKHRAAAQLAIQAQSDQAKSMYYQQQAMMSAAGVPGSQMMFQPKAKPGLSTAAWVGIAAGGVAALGLLVYFARRK